MNKFDERYEIRMATKFEIPQIMEFISEYWKGNHVLSIDRVLFEYEFLDDDGETVNILLAIDKNTNYIEGIFGFLKCSNTKDLTKRDIWGSFWKVVDDHDNIPFLGVELGKRLIEQTKCRMHVGVGANPKTTVPLRKIFFKDKIGKMDHYYYLNPLKTEFHIALIKERPKRKVNNEFENVRMIKLDSMDSLIRCFDIENLEVKPYKDNWYFNKRYFEHPYYTYDVYAIQNQHDIVEAIIVIRIVAHDKYRIMRIVDYLGNQALFGQLESEFSNLVEQHDCEYIDFYVLGFEEKQILQAGFVKKNKNNINVIPNYFEPFVRENVDIWVHYKYNNTLIFKADGDQDRPNNLRLQCFNGKGEV